MSYYSEPPKEPKPRDVDLDRDSPHHTIGKGPNQAAAGNHTHHVIRTGTTVAIADGAGGAVINVGPWDKEGGVPIVVNGDYPACPSVICINVWNATLGTITLTNIVPNNIFRVNWMVG